MTPAFGAVLALGLALGVDNMRVAAALGAAGASATQAVRLAGAFAVFEATMPLVGLVLGGVLAEPLGALARLAGALALAACGIYVLVISLRKKGVRSSLRGSWVLYGLPLALSLDNLAAGFGLGMLGLPIVASAFIIGAMSGLLCLLGFRLGEIGAGWLSHRAQMVGGAVLVVLATLHLVGG